MRSLVKFDLHIGGRLGAPGQHRCVRVGAVVPDLQAWDMPAGPALHGIHLILRATWVAAAFMRYGTDVQCVSVSKPVGYVVPNLHSSVLCATCNVKVPA